MRPESHRGLEENPPTERWRNVIEIHLFDESANKEEALCGIDAPAENLRSVGCNVRDRPDGTEVETVCQRCKARSILFAMNTVRGRGPRVWHPLRRSTADLPTRSGGRPASTLRAGRRTGRLSMCGRSPGPAPEAAPAGGGSEDTGRRGGGAAGAATRDAAAMCAAFFVFGMCSTPIRCHGRGLPLSGRCLLTLTLLGRPVGLPRRRTGARMKLTKAPVRANADRSTVSGLSCGLSLGDVGQVGRRNSNLLSVDIFQIKLWTCGTLTNHVQQQAFRQMQVGAIHGMAAWVPHNA